METLLRQLKVNEILTLLALLGLLWRLGQIVSILRTGLSQHQVMWWYTTKKIGVRDDTDPAIVKEKLRERLEAKARAAHK